MKKIFFFLTIASCTSFAQITITSSDVLDMFAAGKTISSHEDTLISSIDIGSPGGGNNWDFTMLKSHYTLTSEGVNPATTSYINDFSGANICTYNLDYFEGELAEVWNYSAINTNWDNLGSAITINSQPGNVIQIKNNPPARETLFPFTYNSSNSSNYTQTTEFNGTVISSSNVSTTALVDAYGTMTLPGGASFDALRIRISETNGADVYLDYIFFSKSGAIVNIYTSNPNLPNSGTINIDGASYNGVPTISGVEQIGTSPINYDLGQNYPNPFNPTTNIEYSIPEQSIVDIRIYDILGNEIAVLVNKEQAAGRYKADFNGINLTSGVYFYRLQAGGFVETKKMILLK
jgi:hypothetical protein